MQLAVVIESPVHGRAYENTWLESLFVPIRVSFWTDGCKELSTSSALQKSADRNLSSSIAAYTGGQIDFSPLWRGEDKCALNPPTVQLRNCYSASWQLAPGRHSFCELVVAPSEYVQLGSGKNFIKLIIFTMVHHLLADCIRFRFSSLAYVFSRLLAFISLSRL